MRLPSIFGYASLFTVAIVICGEGSAQPRKAALLIGNDGYAAAPLRNARHDARELADALSSIGFETRRVEDVSLAGMVEALRAFGSSARNHDIRLLYFAGHGAQLGDRGYVLPVDASFGSAQALSNQAVAVSTLVQLFEGGPGVSVVILDACRGNPFGALAPAGEGRRLKTRGPGTAVVAPGLSAASPPGGTLIAYSAAPGQLALDGGASSRNGVYTKHLIAHIGIANLPVEDLLKRVRAAVRVETGGAQTPWESSSLTGLACLAGHAEHCGTPQGAKGRR